VVAMDRRSCPLWEIKTNWIVLINYFWCFEDGSGLCCARYVSMTALSAIVF